MALFTSDCCLMALITSDCCFGKGITGKTTDAAYKQRVVMDPCIGNGAPPLPLPFQDNALQGAVCFRNPLAFAYPVLRAVWR